MKRAVFLDRDGVVNKPYRDGGYLPSWEAFEFCDGVLEAVALLNEAGFFVIVVTNQSCVGKGIVSSEAVEEIHANMVRSAAGRGAVIDAVYYCPHLAEDDCDCKKPKPGMLERGMRAFGVEGTRSFMVGDSIRDLEAGRAVGATTFWVNPAGHEVSHRSVVDYEVKDLREAADIILGKAH